MKEVGKIYSAVDAEDLDAGDIVVVGDSIKIIDKCCEDGIVQTLDKVRPTTHHYRFSTTTDDAALAKLICPKKHAEVYKAWKNGVKVEIYSKVEDKWFEVDKNDSPIWNEDIEYRIAEEQKPKYRPFKSINELIDTWEKMMGYTARSNCMLTIWVKDKNFSKTFAITSFDFGNDILGLDFAHYSLAAVFDCFTFLDGSPFGVKE